MRNDDTPMWDDPNEPAFVRELLKSARQNPVAYDVERGLSEHLARIAAGAAAPPWAEVGAVAKSAVPAWVGYVIVPLAAAGIAGLAWVFTGQSVTPPVTPTTAESPSAAAVAAVGAPALDSESARASSAPAIEGPAAPADSAARAARPPRPPRPLAEPAAPEPSSRSARASRAHGRSAKALATGSDSVASSATSTSADGAESGQGQGNTVQSSAAAGRPVPEAQSQRPSHATDSLNAPQPEAAERREPDERPARAPTPARDAAQAKTDSAPVPVVDEARLEREMQMLAVTQRVLAANPARALRLSQQGEREFPNTMFSAERRQLGLLALVKLGRLDEARRIGQPFLAKYPNAPWSERLRRALASGVVD